MSDDDNIILRVGNVVRVKNIPGPRMVLLWFRKNDDGEDRAGCMWFDRRYNLQSAQFNPRHLAKASPWQERSPTEPDEWIHCAACEHRTMCAQERHCDRLGNGYR